MPTENSSLGSSLGEVIKDWASKHGVEVSEVRLRIHVYAAQVVPASNGEEKGRLRTEITKIPITPTDWEKILALPWSRKCRHVLEEVHKRGDGIIRRSDVQRQFKDAMNAAASINQRLRNNGLGYRFTCKGGHWMDGPWHLVVTKHTRHKSKLSIL